MSEHMPQRLLSVVIPVFNEQATVEEIVERVRNVEIPLDCEIVLIDDGSQAAEAVVVRTFEDAKHVVEFVTARDIGRITCLIRDGFERTDWDSYQWDGARRLIDLLPETARTDPVVRNLLDRACIVHDLDDARLGAGRFPGASFVTPRGEVLQQGGSLTGGQGGTGAGIISRRAELDSIQEEIAVLASRVEELGGRMGALEGERDALRSERREQVARTDSLRCRHAEAVAHANALAEELRRLGDVTMGDESEMTEMRQIISEASSALSEKETALGGDRRAPDLDRGGSSPAGGSARTASRPARSHGRGDVERARSAGAARREDHEPRAPLGASGGGAGGEA